MLRVRYVRFGSPPPPPNPNGSNKHRSGGFFESGTWPVKVGGVFVGLGGLYYVSHLEQVEETGRWRFMNVSPETEAEVGKMSRSQITRQFSSQILPSTHPLSLHVQRVVLQILQANNLGTLKNSPLSPTQSQHPTQQHFDIFPDTYGAPSNPFEPSSSHGVLGGSGGYGWSGAPSEKTVPDQVAGPQKEWEVIVVDNKKIVNAAATPGTVIVFTGILPVCKDEQGLAAVLAHVARHTGERLSSQVISIALTVFISATLASIGIGDYGLSAWIEEVAVGLRNSRVMETEADLIGLRLMSKACYEPDASPGMFSRLGRLESQGGGAGARVPEFLRTHPTSETRVKVLESHLPEAYDLFNANPECAKMREFREVSGRSGKPVGAFI
ncbi:hypothetical protein D9758_014700 [Tetrapyrgos nigripes]|uniref:Peptidase M48 domain-containing protein n=1 Tax=Tetrapyrgos nigripes TaxID=182062 RepID=A0A8H5FNU2_9AGAR|nr:hypothetical protein D9758_014700 [Tetrapyrgos nigripes]